MFRRVLVVLVTILIILSVGWLTLRRSDIPYDRLETLYASADSRFVVLNENARMHFRDVGPRDAPVIVLVHGFSSSLHTWESWVKTLKREYRVISLDLPGHGLTGCPDVENTSIDQFAGALDQLVVSLGVDQFTLVGSSMGGNTAWTYALKHPEKLEALVLVGAAGWPETNEEAASSPLIFKLLENDMARAIIRDLDMTSLVRAGLADSFVDTSFVTEEMVARYVSLSRAPCHRDTLLQMAGQENRSPATPERLGVLRMPTLILQGDGDKLVPPAHAEKFHAAIPNSQLIMYENVGHLPQEEIASRSVTDLTGFLAKLQTGPTSTGMIEAGP